MEDLHYHLLQMLASLVAQIQAHIAIHAIKDLNILANFAKNMP